VRAGAVNMADWHRCADRALTLEAFEGEEAKAGVDLASKLDLAAAALVFTRTVEGARHYYAFTRSYLPGDAVADGGPNAAAYAKWARIGHLVLTEGAEIDHDVVRDDILDWRKRFAVAEVVYDPARATMLAQHLVKAGMTVVEFTTTSPAAMGAAFDELLAAIRAGRFHHDGNEVLTWAAANVVARPATKGIVVPSKVTKMSHMKIDPIVAVCLALYRAMFGQAEKPKRSVYETRGVIAI
jgi:phage terminase large subunit-like protein